ncbi:YebC/PmpR family DNA-binding transcriptional regulator [Patescibacteria group bacterium]|nr:YebC/PmpR family DNA-binding transcriptional regulator [Patescibacteria group bacterium]MBU4162040.1 YebC/PmpR family DNA-binding transcriptional regulator [Patescibacteria group bacterium]
MSGHSHWATIKRGKEAEDRKRAQIFSKLSRVISVAAKIGGDPQMNPSLRIAVEQAKKANMPSENIERAIKKGIGELQDEILEEFCFEAYGPAKSALIITGITNNKNRTLTDIKQLLSHNNAKLANEGSVKWQFENMGIIILEIPEAMEENDLEMAIIEAGAEDIKKINDLIEVCTKPEDLETVKRALEEKKFNIESVNLGWIAKEEIDVDEKEKASIGRLFEALDDNDDVQDIYSNIKL